VVLEAVAAAGLSPLGLSGQGRIIAGRLFSGRPSGPNPKPKPKPGAVARANAPRLLFFGGIHGDEPASVESLLEFARRLSLEAVPHEGGDVMIVPALNPDGLLLGTKNSSRDVDLNRNFPASNFTRAHLPGYDPGPAPLSEPESAFLARIVDTQAIDAVVAVHAPFACVNFDGPARAWADEVAAACGWPVRENIGYPTPGSLGSWLGIDRDMPVLTLELPPGPLAGFRAAAAAALDRARACAGALIGA
jgi:murein peptide amidase A